MKMEAFLFPEIFLFVDFSGGKSKIPPVNKVDALYRLQHDFIAERDR